MSEIINNPKADRDSSEVDATKALELAQSIVRILNDFDSATRRRAVDVAMTCLGEKTTVSPASVDPADGRSKNHTPISLEGFFNRNEKLKPAENAQLCAAYHYALHGGVPFSLDEIRSIASSAGVILPDRLHMTFQAASRAGKKLFQFIGKGLFKPTAAAGILFQERWTVRPGTAPKSS